MALGLRGELKQTKPFKSVEEEAALSIFRTAACLEHAFAQALKPYDVTRLLDRMEEIDLIARRRGGADRRYVTTTISEKGLKLLDALDDTVRMLHRDQLGHLKDARLRQLVDLLAAARNKA
jgi:DNA-binding MarR family transcriptional regulator